MRLTLTLATLAMIISSAEINAREIEIGHLETKDDPDAISSWLFFHCDENGDLMICDAFQTLIARELQPEQRASEIEKQMQGDPVKQFSNSMGADCDKDKMDAMSQATKTGKSLDGQPLDAKALQDYMPFLKAMNDACASPTVNTVRRVVEIYTDRKIKTCRVSNFYSKIEFRWNEQTQKWFSQEGPSGPCGAIRISSLETDKEAKLGGVTLGTAKNSSFWLYTQKRLFTNLNGPGCSKFSEHVTHYTWRTSTNLEDCRYIEHQVQ
jgi:hypothetical protein